MAGMHDDRHPRPVTLHDVVLFVMSSPQRAIDAAVCASQFCSPPEKTYYSPILIQTQPPLTTVPCIAGVPNDAQLSIGTNTEELDVKWGL